MRMLGGGSTTVIRFVLIMIVCFYGHRSLLAQDDTESARTAVEPIPPPVAFPAWQTGTEGKTLIVDLSDFRIYAYENGDLIRSSLVSIGRFNMATLTGDYAVLRKAEVSDLTYRGVTVPDVPYILAYTDTFAIHAAYWHDNWGQRVTSGCVNLPIDEAAWYYAFADVGTPVLIQE